MIIRPIEPSEYSALEELTLRDPVVNVYVASKLADVRQSNPTFRLNVLGAFSDGHLIAGVYLGANIIPIQVPESLTEVFATHIRDYVRGPIPLTGQAQQVLGLWGYLSHHWGTPREIRSDQPLLTISDKPNIAVDDQVRYSRFVDLDLLFPACVDMFTEEVGVSPIIHGVGPYRTRVQDLIALKRSFVRIDQDVVVFKAEVGAVSSAVAQIQGVWVNPKYRGQGLAAPALASVVQKVRDDLAPTASLYVNSYNKPALATYKAVGFTQVDTFASILF